MKIIETYAEFRRGACAEVKSDPSFAFKGVFEKNNTPFAIPLSLIFENAKRRFCIKIEDFVKM